MADKAEPGVDAQITFKVKTSSDIIHAMTMNETTTVLDLKTKLAGQDLENIPVDRQRLIYSGRVMNNDDTLASYKIKPNNTIHMVKSAASNPSQPSSTSAHAPQAVPSNMASGTANNPLAGLTGARYAGHQINLPNMNMFGPDGGMGPPMSEERLQQMMSDPNIQQAMREALNNPDFVNSLIDSNPMLRNMPSARELINSPGIQQLMSNPSLLQNAMRLQRMMSGAGNIVFPAPGATDMNPSSGNGSGNDSGNAQQNPPFNPAILSGLMMGGGAGQGTDMQNVLQFVHRAVREIETGAASSAATSNTPREESRDGQEPGQDLGHQNLPANNPFSALFSTQAHNPLGMNNETMQQMMQIMGQSMPAPSPPDNRPPEDRYVEQLRQLNDMGFCDFGRNVAALRQSGGSVQGAIEHLLSATD